VSNDLPQVHNPLPGDIDFGAGRLLGGPAPYLNVAGGYKVSTPATGFVSLPYVEEKRTSDEGHRIIPTDPDNVQVVSDLAKLGTATKDREFIEFAGRWGLMGFVNMWEMWKQYSSTIDVIPPWVTEAYGTEPPALGRQPQYLPEGGFDPLNWLSGHGRSVDLILRLEFWQRASNLWGLERELFRHELYGLANDSSRMLSNFQSREHALEGLSAATNPTYRLALGLFPYAPKSLAGHPEHLAEQIIEEVIRTNLHFVKFKAHGVTLTNPLEAVYLHLRSIINREEGITIGLCPECDHVFVTRKKQQRFCAPIKLNAKRSRCQNTHSNRQSRLRMKGGSSG